MLQLGSHGWASVVARPSLHPGLVWGPWLGRFKRQNLRRRRLEQNWDWPNTYACANGCSIGRWMMPTICQPSALTDYATLPTAWRET
jgi:hypothetical protein